MEILTHRGAFAQDGCRFFYIHTLVVRILLEEYADYLKTICAKLRSLGRIVSLCLCVYS